MDEDHVRLLDVLQSHGQQFLESFGDLPNSKKRKRAAEPANLAEQVESSEEEWGGIDWDDVESSGESRQNDDSELEDEEVGAKTPDVVVFSSGPMKPSNPSTMSKVRLKAFMSSKVSKVTQDIIHEELPEIGVNDGEDEKTNVQNDALLHRLVHTQLLPGSLNRDLNLSRADHRKALAGRILELAGSAKLGKGEKLVREAERNKASKRVREGLLSKVQQRGKQQFEEAKDLGNYHPTLKNLFRSSSPPPKKRRERGLKMGVGRYKNGYLDLQKEAAMLQGDRSDRGRGKFKSRNKKK
ncbi:hypothetical protein BDN72DRAFT_831431 [Pluteus cervinus]|uniref:Uncharacterized protein n=1 Tax=Pluteus cervinus TaxID=181527 RepID=A0ACD3BEB1_9AGAR|nr:hypothetical protein BDN72DRAFT_831431 [Pluteus cervinus]